MLLVVGKFSIPSFRGPIHFLLFFNSVESVLVAADSFEFDSYFLRICLILRMCRFPIGLSEAMQKPLSLKYRSARAYLYR